MKIKFLPTGQAPDQYSFNGDIVTAFHDGQSEDFDLSSLENGDEFKGLEVDTLSIDPRSIIREAYRDESGELHLTLCQRSGGVEYWIGSDEMDAEDYDPNEMYIKEVSKKEYRKWVTQL